MTNKKHCINLPECSNNPYFKANPGLFSRLVRILNESLKVTNALKTIRHDTELKTWILKTVVGLYDTSAKLGAYVNWIISGRTDPPRCKVCGKVLKVERVMVFGTYKKWCSTKCVANDPEYRAFFAKRLEDKYGPGIDHPSKIPGVTEKVQAKLAAKTPEEKAAIREKTRRSFIEHYGVDNNMKSEAGMAEYKASMQKKYGVDYTWEIPEVVEKAKNSTLEHFGVTVSSQAEEVKKTQAETNMRVYGSKCALQNPEVGKKTRASIRRIYGVDHYSQNPEVRKRQTYNWYEYNGISFNSSWELAFWIYNTEHGIKTEREPRQFKYVDSKGKSHVYFPDFLVNGVQLVEIKGDDQFDENGRMIDKLDPNKNYIAEAKQLCMEKLGVVVIRSQEIRPYLKYVETKYGKDYLKGFKKRKEV